MHPPSSLHLKDADLGWRIVLGFEDPDVPGWSRVRGAQYDQLSAFAPLICLMNILGALLLVLLLAGTVPAWQLGLWSGFILFLLLTGVRQVRKREAGTPPTRSALARSTLRAAGLGLVWTAPTSLFAVRAVEADRLAICLVAAALAASAVLTGFSMPLGMLAFILLTCGGISVLLSQAGSDLAALLPVIYAAALCAGGIAGARSFVKRRWAEQGLEEKSAYVSLLLRESEQTGGDWLWQVDAARALYAVSPRFAHAAGRSPAALEGMPLAHLLGHDESGSQSGDVATLMSRVDTHQMIGEMTLAVEIDGETRWWTLSAAPRFDISGGFAGYRGVGSDVTEQRRSADRIEQLARLDALTQLPNRAHVIDTLRQALAGLEGGACGTALLLIDLDKFKPVNDTLGHPTGDRLLALAAARMLRLVGRAGLCGRLGGDEFAVVLRDAEAGMVEAIGVAIVEALSEPFEIDGSSVRVGASIGAAIAPEDGRSVDVLLRNADLALYRAKADGRGRFRRYDPSLLIAADSRRAIGSALREAIERDQFRLLYQPVVDVDTGRIESMEALLRWTHPTLGDIPVPDFMPVAEEQRLSGAIGAWVLRTACVEAAGWGDGVPLSVNLSGQQIADRQLSAHIVAALACSGLPAHRLVLEVSERILAAGDAGLVAALDALNGLGVRVALDDFGTGHAALGYVRGDRFSAIKIDAGFVHGPAATGAESAAIVRAVVAMADSLGVPTVAEGVETDAQLARMYALGCRRVQGHLAAAPMPPEAARALVAARHGSGARVGEERSAA